jgi:hypothetical protein
MQKHTHTHTHMFSSAIHIQHHTTSHHAITTVPNNTTPYSSNIPHHITPQYHTTSDKTSVPFHITLYPGTIPHHITPQYCTTIHHISVPFHITSHYSIAPHHITPTLPPRGYPKSFQWQVELSCVPSLTDMRPLDKLIQLLLLTMAFATAAMCDGMNSH